jgi:hypothetical protein
MEGREGRRMRRTTRFAPALGFGITLVLAAAAYAGDPSRDLGDIESAPSRDVGDVDSAESGDSDGASAGAEAEDVVGSEDSDAANAESGEMQEGATKSFDEVDAGSSGWQPAPCEEVEVDLGSRPPASDVEAWRGELQNAQAAIDTARTKLAAADAEYTYARNRNSPRGEALGKIKDVRDKARKEFAKARCSLPARVEEARRLGVPAEIWRDFPASIE